MSDWRPTAALTRTLVVVPTYDEIENIDILIARVQAAQPDAHLLVVDDNSPDGTGDRVAGRVDFGRRVHLLRRANKAGLGAAYRAGSSPVAARAFGVSASHQPTAVSVSWVPV